MGFDDDVGVGGFPVYLCGEFAFSVPCKMYVEESNAIINFCFTGEFDSGVYTVQNIVK